MHRRVSPPVACHAKAMLDVELDLVSDVEPLF